MSRPAWAEVDLRALQANARYLKTLRSGKLLAVVKADAYGHGAVPTAQALAPCVDGFAVSCLEEALALREADIDLPIVLLEGFFDPAELPVLVEHHLQPVIHHLEQVEQLLAANLSAPLTVWLKLDSGMHRLGFDAATYTGIWQRLQQAEQVSDVVKMTHFARADELAVDATNVTTQQMDVFFAVADSLPGPSSLANSPALLAWPRACCDYNRTGLALYGVSPFSGENDAAKALQPVMRFCAKVIAVQSLPEGAAVGYGGTFVTPKPMRIGVVAAGYADGYPRHAKNGTPVAVQGQKTQLVGRVSMDMLTIDLTELPEAAVGSEVELWGNVVPVAEVARCADSIPYELLSHLKRVPRRYNQ